MKYINIYKNNEKTLSDDKLFSKKELLNKFEEFINNEEYKIEKIINYKSAPYELLISNPESELFYLVIYLKNITGAGWKNKPSIRRVQVNNILNKRPDSYIDTTKNKTFIILGYYNFDDNPIMVAWDAYRYIDPKTNRSAYIQIDTLLRGYKAGYLETVNANQKIWVFTNPFFDKFLQDYIGYNEWRQHENNF